MKKYINASYWLTDWLGSADQIQCVCMAVYDHDWLVWLNQAAL